MFGSVLAVLVVVFLLIVLLDKRMHAKKRPLVVANDYPRQPSCQLAAAAATADSRFASVRSEGLNADPNALDWSSVLLDSLPEDIHQSQSEWNKGMQNQTSGASSRQMIETEDVDLVPRRGLSLNQYRKVATGNLGIVPTQNADQLYSGRTVQW